LFLKADLTLELLQQGKRFHATTSLLADTGIKEAIEMSLNYSILMKDFPVFKLLNAQNLDVLQEGITEVFGHLNKKLKLTNYPAARAIRMVENMARSFNDVVLKILKAKQVLNLSTADFNFTISTAIASFSFWDDNIREFIHICREISRKKHEKVPSFKVEIGNLQVSMEHSKLEERLIYLLGLRKQHEDLCLTLESLRCKMQQDESFQERGWFDQLDAAYSILKSHDSLDVSESGSQAWFQVEKKYQASIEELEASIVLILQQSLSQSKNSCEMFKIFSTFNVFFGRPKVSLIKM
jgi:hypothetical protein